MNPYKKFNSNNNKKYAYIDSEFFKERNPPITGRESRRKNTEKAQKRRLEMTDPLKKLML